LAEKEGGRGENSPPAPKVRQRKALNALERFLAGRQKQSPEGNSSSSSSNNSSSSSSSRVEDRCGESSSSNTWTEMKVKDGQLVPLMMSRISEQCSSILDLSPRARREEIFDRGFASSCKKMRIEAHCSQVGLAESARIDYDESAERAFDESAKAYDDEQAQDFDESARSTDGSDISSASSNEKYFHKKFGSTAFVEDPFLQRKQDDKGFANGGSGEGCEETSHVMCNYGKGGFDIQKESANVDMVTIPDYEESSYDNSQELDDLKITEFSNIPLLFDVYLEDNNCMSFVMEMESTFFKVWSQVYLGEALMKDFIGFCKNQDQPLPSQFLTNSSKQNKERYLSATNKLRILEDLPISLITRTMRERLDCVYPLLWITMFNLTLEGQFNFVLAQRDKNQWQAQCSPQQFASLETIIMRMQFPKETRMRLFDMISEHTGSVFTDRVVHMLMVVLILFDANDSEEMSRNVQGVTLGILKRHLALKSESPDADYGKVLRCVQALPEIAKFMGALKTSEEGNIDQCQM